VATKNVYDIGKMTEKIMSIKREAIELKRLAGDIQAVDRNVESIWASVKMLEINVSDIANIS
jgi:hypothetical protein